jgi:ABC-2 type transport system permease protein
MMQSPGLRQEIVREWRLLLSDTWLRAMVSWVPLLVFFILWWIFSAGLPRDLAIGVVDLDHSDLSRSLVRQYDAHPGLRIANEFSDTRQGSAALRSGEINGLIVIPYEFKNHVITGRSPQITAFFNSQFLLTGNMIASSLQQAHGTLDARLEVVRAMVDGEVGSQAVGAAVPVGMQITPLFNLNTNYANFLVSALIPASWQIIIVMVTMLALSRETRLQGVAVWLVDKPMLAITGKIFPYTIIMWGQGALFLWFMFGILHWPMNGSWAILLLSQLLMVLACQAMGLLLFLLVQDPARSLSLAAAYTAPGFAFMGVTFPATDMALPAQLWRELLPVSHYIDIQLYQANHGASIMTALPQMAALLLFFVAFLLSYKMALRIVQRADLSVKDTASNVAGTPAGKS